jgi:hypothetical protein
VGGKQTPTEEQKPSSGLQKSVSSGQAIELPFQPHTMKFVLDPSICYMLHPSSIHTN